MLTLLGNKNWEAILQIYKNLFFNRIKDYPEDKIEQSAKVAVQERCYLEVSEAIANADIDIGKIKAEVFNVFYLDSGHSWRGGPFGDQRND